MKKSKLGKLGWGDFLRGAIVAVLAGVVTILGTAFTSAAETGILLVSWSMVGYTAVAAFLGYLGKGLGTDENGDILSIKTVK